MTAASNKKIKVAMLIQAYLPIVGGAERQIAALAPHLKSLDIDIHIITRRYPGLASFEMINTIPVYRVPIPGPKLIASVAFTLSALWRIWQIRPDILHAHELLSPTTTAVAAKRLFGIPVVAKVLRGGELGDLQKLSSRALGRIRLKQIKKVIDQIIVISQEIEQELLHEGFPSGKLGFIPNGVDINKFKPVSEDQKEGLRKNLGLPDGPIGVFIGRLSPEKRVDQIINAWPVLRRKHPQASLTILGTGPQESELRAMSGEGIIFAGVVDDVPLYLQAADFFVLPSSTEGLSNALLEAMASGLPIIATKVGGAEDLIEHQKSGWLIPADDTVALNHALEHFLSNLDQLMGYGEKAREKVVQDYSLERVANMLRALYDQVKNK
jgi:glycosyltransferase involved in cell wall biosynthesis